MEKSSLRIRVGLASFGMSGRLFHAPFIEQHPDYQLSAIVERHRDDSRELYPESKLYRSFDQMIDDPEIDLVVVNTPVQTHFDFAQKALLKGKNVVVEKPFTVDAKQAEILAELSEKQNCTLSVYQNRRWDGDFAHVQNIIQSGVLGSVKEAEIQFCRYRLNISTKTHKETSEAGGGTLHDLGTHIIDQALVLFGFPKSLFADLGKFRPDSQTNDYFEIILFYENELRVRLKASSVAREHQMGYIIHCEKGSLLQERMDTQETELSAGKIPKMTNWTTAETRPNGLITTDIRKEIITQSGNYMDYYEALYQYIANGKTNPVTAEQAWQTMRIVDASIVSHHEKRIVDLP